MDPNDELIDNNPNDELDITESKQFVCYDITNDGIFLREIQDRKRFEFWDDLLNEFKQHWNITFDFRKLN